MRLTPEQNKALDNALDASTETVFPKIGQCLIVDDVPCVIVRHADLLELAEDSIALADQQYPARDDYPHQQAQYDRDTETARAVIDTAS